MLCLISVNQRMKANHNDIKNLPYRGLAVPNISKSKNESKSQLHPLALMISISCA